jgi:hypothetical protein
MTRQLSASEVLDREFLAMRCRVIDLAAALDRVDRASPTTSIDPRVELLRRTFDILASDSPSRAERIQQIFSLPYEENWRA